MKPVAAVNWLSTVDYPDKITATVYFNKCPFRCVYCYNQDIVHSPGKYSFQEVINKLSKNNYKNMLEGVVFTGGEPTAHPDLPEYASQVIDIGYEFLGLHTTGFYLDTLRQTLPYLTWVGLDFKGPPEKYYSITGRDCSLRVWQSMDLLNESNILYEIRTTVFALKDLSLDEKDLVNMAKTIKSFLKGSWVLQQGYKIENDRLIPLINEDDLLHYADAVAQIINKPVLVRTLRGSFTKRGD